ncbi:MAG: manganese-dependent inorganic pyrophosphatase [Solirubrobacteraceae bacterium]|jgi:manganese-dependent inorganic pyrophosphatase|nr:manganese-dependent inorganic pyrophosphatase [Solirubrobacteraceae bacterium]
MATVYVTGHRNPDTDSIASAIGYAELKGRLDPRNEYVASRLGDLNAQTRWVLDRSGAREPELLPHVLLRVRDVMLDGFPTVNHREPIRQVGLTMARQDLELMPIVDDDGALAGVMTERTLARRYIRESRDVTSLADAAASVQAIVEQLDGELVSGDGTCELAGRVWVLAMDAGSLPDEIGAGDVVVVGNREDAQRRSIDLGVALLVTSNGTRPTDDVLALAAERGTTVVSSPWDSYVTSRMVTLSAPCRALMDGEPLTVRPDDLVADVSAQISSVDYRAAVAVDGAHRPVGVVTHAELVSPEPRRVLLVDHAEQAQSVVGVEHAEIVEILDHHHVGSIETTVPVLATFDPVGSTATLVVERFRRNGMEPTGATAMALLGAVLSDTVILNSPTTTERDHDAVEYLERVLAIDATTFGREMFESTSDVSEVDAEAIVTRDAKEYAVGDGQTLVIAQIETVGDTVLARRDELLDELASLREARGHALYALMVTDIMAKGTKMLVAGDHGAIERVFGQPVVDGTIDLPGVMSRKKQVAPKLLGAL